MFFDQELEPWIVPSAPSLERLAMELADLTGLTVTPLPSAAKGGIVLGNLPPFLIWKHVDLEKKLHLLFFQPREIGSLVDGASNMNLDPWIVPFPLFQMNQLLALHPDIGRPLEVTLVKVEQGPRAYVRSTASQTPFLAVLRVLNRISAQPLWIEGHIKAL